MNKLISLLALCLGICAGFFVNFMVVFTWPGLLGVGDQCALVICVSVLFSVLLPLMAANARE